MEESANYDIVLQDDQIKDLVQKIKVMWKTIEDLKNKVMEEKDLLKKEKSENERMMEEQVKLRKQLSMFHLPHCPAYNSPPCPVHSFNARTHTFTASQSPFDPYFGDQKDGLFGTNDVQCGDSAERQTLKELMRSLDPQPAVSTEDLFDECREAAAQDQTSDFTLLMSEQWQSRLATANARAHKLQSATSLQVETTQFTVEPGETQLSTSTHVCRNH